MVGPRLPVHRPFAGRLSHRKPDLNALLGSYLTLDTLADDVPSAYPPRADMETEAQKGLRQAWLSKEQSWVRSRNTDSAICAILLAVGTEAAIPGQPC